MASLTTVYIVSLVLASISGIGSAFVGHSFYPWKGGAEQAVAEPEAKPEPQPEVKVEPEPTPEPNPVSSSVPEA